MTFKEILEREEQNSGVVWLYKEGMFMKAYERSAFFVHTYIHDFKLSKRFIKSVNQELISLGFPIQTLPKWLNAYPYEALGEDMVLCHIGKQYDEVSFHNWKELAHVNAGDRFTPHTAVIEKSQVYKLSYDLLVQVYELCAHISKNNRQPLGERLKQLAYELTYMIRRLYEVPDRGAQIEKAKEFCAEIEFNLQVLRDLKEISVSSFALASERIVSVSKQLSALYGKVKA